MWLETVRLARDFGDVAQLLPDGIADLRDAPHHIFDAIARGNSILRFFELPDDERPPRRIWLDDERLEEWFAEVNRKRSARAEGRDKEIEDPVDNDAAKGLIVG